MNISAAGVPAHERVYRQLRDEVLFGDLVPGDAVTIQGLVARLGAGMTPVREALRRLTAEGALEFQGNRRICVPVLDAAALNEVTYARLALEPELAARACARIEIARIAALSQVDAALDAALAAGDLRGYLMRNHRFHAMLFEQAQAPVLTELAVGLWLRFGPSLRAVLTSAGPPDLPDRHKDLLSALAARDAQAAAQAIRQDIAQGMEAIAAALPD